MTIAERVYDEFEKIEMPEEEGVTVLKFAKGEYKGEYVCYLGHKEQVFLSQIISEEVFPNKDKRFSLLPLQKSYELVYSDTNEGKAFKKINECYKFSNREVILEKGFIIPDPIVIDNEWELVYNGNKIPVNINSHVEFQITNRTVDTLINAGLFKKSEQRIYDGSVGFKNGESSVNSYWNDGIHRFCAESWYPSESSPHHLVALIKI